MAQLVRVFAAKPDDLNFVSRTHSCKLSFDLPMCAHADPSNAIYRNKIQNKTHYTHTLQQRPGLLSHRGSSEVEKDQVCKSHQQAPACLRVWRSASVSSSATLVLSQHLSQSK